MMMTEVKRYEWLPKALDWVEDWRVDKELIEAAASKPTQVTDDPLGADAGYPIKRHRRGDLEVCIGLRNPEMPTIIYIRMHLPMDETATGGKGPVGGVTRAGGRGAPKSGRDLNTRIQKAGYKIRVGGNGHLQVLRPEDGSILMTMANSPSDVRSLTNAWRKFEREVTLDSVQDLINDIAEDADKQEPQDQ